MLNRILPRFLGCLLLSLALGYLDMRLSDQFLYHGQMAEIHYWRTLQAHLVLGLILGVFLSAFRNALPTATAALIFLILFVKLHLVFLSTHLADPEGLLWTAAALAASAGVFLLIRRLISHHAKPAKILGGLLLAAVATDAGIKLLRDATVANVKNAPNVLLIVIDTLRYDHLSSYGYSKPVTPSIDALASEGAQYNTAISAAPWTTPSHAALFTGQFPSKNGVEGRNIFLPAESITLAEVLAQHGYQTAGFINNVYIRRQTGIGQGFQQYEEFWGRNEGSSIMLLAEYVRNRRQERTDTGAAETVNAVGDWLKHDRNSENPFFLFVHFMEPHAPYGTPDTAPEFLPSGVAFSDAMKVNQDPESYICDRISMTDRDFEILNALYDSDIRSLDEQIGRFIRMIRDSGLLENTVVILTSDHGEHFGENHLMSHELSVYDALIRIPLIIRYPQAFPAGVRVDTQVQTVDLFPSLLRLLNISGEGLELQGRSLLPEDLEESPYRFAFAEYNNARAVDKIQSRFGASGLKENPVYRQKTLRCIRTPQWKLIVGSDGTRELYELTTDFREESSKIQDRPEQAELLEKRLKEWMTSFRPSRFYRQEKISPEALEELRTLGYVQ